MLFRSSLSKGQKTGYFLDQKLNRIACGNISNDLNVLDCFTNQGGFALNCAKGNAKSVIGIDSSQEAIDRANNNAKINGYENVNFEKADVFDYLEKARDAAKSFDLIILDPPAFAKNKKSVPVAAKGYAKLNRLALKLIPRCGYLVSSSCSQHIEEIEFYDLILKEAVKLGRSLRVVFRGMQSPCHPVLSAMPETQYLKFFIFQVIYNEFQC